MATASALQNPPTAETAPTAEFPHQDQASIPFTKQIKKQAWRSQQE